MPCTAVAKSIENIGHSNNRNITDGQGLAVQHNFSIGFHHAVYVCSYIVVYFISSPGKFKLDTVLHRSETFEMAM